MSSVFKSYLLVVGLLLFLAACVPTTAEPDLPSGSGEVGAIITATPTPAAVSEEPTAVVATPVAETGNGPITLDQLYQNDEYSFTVSYPIGYSVEEFVPQSDQAAAVFAVSVAAPVTEEQTGFVDNFSFDVFVSENTGNLTVAEYAATMPYSAAGTAVRDVVNVKFNSVEGIQQTEDSLTGSNSMPAIQKITYYAQGNYLYTVRVLALSQEALDSYLPVYEQMLASFVLTGEGQTAGTDTVTTGEFVKPDDSELTVVQEESPYENGWVVKAVSGVERRVMGTDGREYYYVRLSLSNPDTGSSWTVVEEWRPYGLGFTIPALFKWSGDAQSIYYTNIPHPDGCAAFVNGWDLHKFNFETGEDSTVLVQGGLSMALAAHEQALAYGAGNTLNLYNLNDNSVSPVTLDGQLGAILWAPDFQSVLATVISNPCSPEATYSLIRVLYGSQEVSVVVPPTGQELLLQSWPVFDEVQLTDAAGNLWLLNPTTGELVSAADIQTGSAPAGLVYQSNLNIVKVNGDGSETLLAEAESLSLSPDGSQGMYFDYAANQLVLVDLPSGTTKVIDQDFYAVAQVSWMDNGRLLLGVQRNEGDVGPNGGYLTSYDVAQDTFTVLDGEALMFSSPAAAPNGQTIAYDSGGQAMIYDLTTNSATAFDPTQFAGWTQDEQTRLGSPSYSPDGNQLAWIIGGPHVVNGSWGAAVAIFDLTAQTVKVLGQYAIVGTDGWPAAPNWSPDGQWIAINEWAQDRSQEGLWLYKVDGSAKLHLGTQTAEAVWSPAGNRLAYTRYAQNGERDYFVLNLATEAKQMFDLPGFARLLTWLS